MINSKEQTYADAVRNCSPGRQLVRTFQRHLEEMNALHAEQITQRRASKAGTMARLEWELKNAANLLRIWG